MRYLAWLPLFLGIVLFFKLPFPYGFIAWMVGAVLADALRRSLDPHRPPQSSLVKQLRWWGWALGLASLTRFAFSKFCLVGFVGCLTLSRLLDERSPGKKAAR